MSFPPLRTLASLAAHEWRRCRRSAVSLIGLACMAALAYSESSSSQVWGHPSADQALYGFQLAASVLGGLIAFLLAAGSRAADLQRGQRDLILSRPAGPGVYLLGKFLGLWSWALLLIAALGLFCLATPLLYGYPKLHPPGSFLIVLLLRVLPSLAFTTALALGLTALCRRVIVALPAFLLYFVAAALLPGGHGSRWIDFTGRLYPEELAIEVPLRLRDYSFTALLDPIAPALWAHAALYGILTLVVLALAVGFFSISRRPRPRCSAPPANETVSPGTACGNRPAIPAVVGSFPSARLANEASLLAYSAKILVGRNLVAVALVAVGLALMVMTYSVGPFQTRESVLLYQLEMFGPLLGILMFSDLLAADFEARRADLLRVSVRGSAWIARRRLAHAALFAGAAAFALLLVLRLVYTRFSLVQAIAILLPGLLFLGTLALLAASLSRKSLVGYAVGSVALLLYGLAEPLQPLTSLGYFLREKIAYPPALGVSGWQVGKLALLALAGVFCLAVLRLAARPGSRRVPMAGSATVLLLTHLAFRSFSPVARPADAQASLAVLGTVERDGLRIERRAVTTFTRRENRSLSKTEVLDVTLAPADGRWRIQSETPVDLAREYELPRLDLQVDVSPPGRISVRARFDLQPRETTPDSLLFHLAPELAISQLTVDAVPVSYTRAGSVVRVPLTPSAASLKAPALELHYAGDLQLPQHLGFEGASRDLLFVISRWFPSLRGTAAGAWNLFHCRLEARVPADYEMAAARLLAQTNGARTFLWETSRPVESVPLIVGRFQKQILDAGPIPLSILTLRGNSNAGRTLQETARVLAFLQSAFGPVPYPAIAIVENPFQNAGGQVQPGIIAIHPDRLAPEHLERLLTAYLPHEAAHLWFGNTLPPWIAEGVAVFANVLWLEQSQGPANAAGFLDREFYEPFVRSRAAPAPLTRERDVALYTRGGYLFRMLQAQVGADKVLAALRSSRTHYAERTFQDPEIASAAFSAALKGLGGLELSEFVEDWTTSLKTFDPAVRSLYQEPLAGQYRLRLDLALQGEIRFPVPVTLVLADGSRQLHTWESKEREGALEIISPTPAVGAEIDPDHWLLDYDRANNRVAVGQATPTFPPPARFAGWRTFTQSDGLPGPDVRTLALDPRGQVWASVWSFESLVNRTWAVAAHDAGRWKPYAPRAESFPLVQAMALLGNECWFGSQGRLRRMAGDDATDYLLNEIRSPGPLGNACFTPNPQGQSPFPGSKVFALLNDSQNRLWVATDHGLALCSAADPVPRIFQRAQGLPGAEVYALAEDAQGGIWAGTERGLAAWNGTQWNPLPATSKDLCLAVAISPHGVVWVGTFRRGILAFDPPRRQLLRFDRRANSLPDTIFSAIACDRHGGVWAGAPDGLHHYDGQAWSRLHRQNSGLPSNRVRSVLVDSADRVWVATDAGVTVYTRQEPPGRT